ncbi:MAG: hypothetical protein Q9166_003308 [cf. Caloplaca sp. 2 TL-2023]
MSQASSSSSAPSNGSIQHHGIRIIPMEESDAAAGCLALAFAKDDVAMYFVETDDTEQWSEKEKWDMHVRIMGSIVMAHCIQGLALSIGPNYDCVALWMPPGKTMDDRLIMFRRGMWELNHKFSSEGKSRFQEEFLPLLHRTKEEVLGNLDNDSWYLVYIGTKPTSRGNGYARRLIEYVTDQVSDQIWKTQRAERCMEYNVQLSKVDRNCNEVNPKFYRKLGFESEKRIHLTRGPKPVEMEIMVRKPMQKNGFQ